MKNKTQTKQLSEIEIGGTFKVGAHEFFVLEHGEGKTSVLYKDLLENGMSFGQNNNFGDSNSCVVRKRLQEFAEELKSIIGADNLLEHVVDLTSDDGLDDYGKTAANVSLLTCGLYRRFVKVIDKHKINEYWWLVTPFSTPTHGDNEWIKCVSPLGDIFLNGFDLINGVRPFCILNSNIFVSI